MPTDDQWLRIESILIVAWLTGTVVRIDRMGSSVSLMMSRSGWEVRMKTLDKPNDALGFELLMSLCLACATRR